MARPILCSPFAEPDKHWAYNLETGEATVVPYRRPASYFYKVQRVGGQQQLAMFAEETREDLPLINALREDVKKWRSLNYEGATQVTKELLAWWGRSDRPRRLFFCQREAVETVIYLNEIRLAGKRTRFKSAVAEADLARLRDQPADPGLAALTRLGCKMATGSGKTVVMAMLVAWTLCNRGQVPGDERFPSAVLVVCPNLTIKERLQVLRPENAENYYAAFDLVPTRLRPLLNAGRVLVTNWHLFAPESEHSEGGKSYVVVNKGAEGPEAFARRVLGELWGRGPILVLNDEAHHAWRPKPADDPEAPAAGEGKAAKAKVQAEDLEEATVWINGLDTLNRAVGVRGCVDLSATPFYIAGSGYVEGAPLPWLVSDFGLVDAIESGIVKIPRLPVSDTTGRPEPRYFRLWQGISENLQPGERLPGRAGKPKPEVVYREAEAALNTLASQWVERYRYIQEASNVQDKTPPVLIIVCDNTDIAEVFYRNISGEEPVEVVDGAGAGAAEGGGNDGAVDGGAADGGAGGGGKGGAVDGGGEEDGSAEDGGDEDGVVGEEGGAAAARKRTAKAKTRVRYGQGRVFPEYFSNREGFTPTIRIDSKLLAQAESGDPEASRQEAAEQLRRVVATVGKPGQPGEQVRCVVSVAMLNEGWDANNVTHILGLRAFGSQLLCEQVVGRGLRRMDYVPDPETGLLTEEYVDIYGVPFSLIPYKGRPAKDPQTIDRPKNHVRALPERAAFEMRFPVVEGYAFALQRNVITADIQAMEPLKVEPEYEPTSVFVKPRLGFESAATGLAGPGEFREQDRRLYYQSTHLQTIEFELARQVVQAMVGDGERAPHPDSNPGLRLQSRHQLFPQVLRLVHAYLQRKVDFRGVDPREVGQEKYFRRIVGLLLAAIRPDESQGEPPLMPLLNRYTATGSTAGVDFKTVKPVFATTFSHVNAVAADTARWEQSAAFRLEQAAHQGLVKFYARNDGLGFTIPYEFMGVSYAYEPDYLVRLKNEVTLVVEIKGLETEQDHAKHQAAQRWVTAVNHWGQLGRWGFHVNKDPQVLGVEVKWIVGGEAAKTAM